ncbi:8295_t:CDS:2 [Dentiscutata erythropus]|uniref:8295_t:CDS:1 n=1 Tax=Dentiscutata erythropus TaxID=1348616 RepID=A0A9N8YZZ8_9GLOM|nr:8295_t:CDS:2 [Dentiscutata erythropus]
MLENFSKSTSAVQTTMNNILSYIQNHNDNINILNTINNSPCAIATLNYPKSEIEKLFFFEATSPEVYDIEKTSTLDKQDHVSEASRKKLLVPVLPWIKKRSSSYTSPMPRENVEMNNQRWAKMRSLIPAKPKDLQIWAWNQVDQYEYYEQLDDDYDVE